MPTALELKTPNMQATLRLSPQNVFIPNGFVVSVLIHLFILFGIGFVAPDAFHFRPVETGLEVILVNAKHDKKPQKADAIAQTNLDGGGNADEGRAKSPLPDLRKVEDGDDIKVASRRIETLEKQQQQILSQVKTGKMAVAPHSDENRPEANNVPLAGSDLIDSSKALARSVAEITQKIEDQNKRPRKTFITPSTQAAGYALYYKSMQKKVEEFGTLNFPQKDGKKMYGQLLLYIPIFQDGTIYDKEGGVKIERSSGNPALDAAAIRIVQRSAPFGSFPANMRSGDRDDIWVVVTHFKFTREEKMEAELRGGN